MILSQKGKEYDKLFPAYKDAGINIRFYVMGDFSVIIRDREECMLALKSKELVERINVNIRNQDMSNSLQEYFQNMWKKSTRELKD